MFKKILLIIFISAFIFTNNTNVNAANIDLKIRQAFIKLDKSINKKYKSDKGLNYYKKIIKKLDLITQKKELSNSKHKVVSDLKKLINEKIFTLELNKREYPNKITLNTTGILKGYNFLYNSDGIKKEGNDWYAYIFTKMLFFENVNKIGEKELEHYNLKPYNTIVYKDGERVYFVQDYKKIKIASNSDLYGVPGKYEILKFLKKNKINIQSENFEILKDIEAKTYEVIKGKTLNSEKIKAIYAYILGNVTYSNNFKLSDYWIYDGLETFKNKDGVCEGYVQLFKLMLAYADIKSEIVVGDVIDARDFPDIGHAWVKVGDKYFDPTFDDPLGANSTKTFDQYKYFNLPKDIFYTNRFNEGETPESYKTKSLEERKSIIWNNLLKVSEKYKNDKFNILKPFTFRVNNNLNKENLTIEDFKKIMDYKVVKKDFSVQIKGKTKYIKKLNYFTATDKNIESIISSKYNYEIPNDLYLFEWELNSGEKTYRLGYNVEFVD